MFIWKINPLIFQHEEEQSNEKWKEYKAQRDHTCQNLQRHIPPVSLLLWHKIVAIYCFVWSLDLRVATMISEAVSDADQILSFGDFLNHIFDLCFLF